MIHYIWGGNKEFAFQTSFQVMMILLIEDLNEVLESILIFWLHDHEQAPWSLCILVFHLKDKDDKYYLFYKVIVKIKFVKIHKKEQSDGSLAAMLRTQEELEIKQDWAVIFFWQPPFSVIPLSLTQDPKTSFTSLLLPVF